MKNCLIVDDDNSTSVAIRAVGIDFPEISILKTSENQEKALNLILKEPPDIVVLSIDSSKINLSEFLYEIREYCIDPPVLIAISSRTENAFLGYKYNFTDFLLKPLTNVSIRKCLLKCIG